MNTPSKLSFNDMFQKLIENLEVFNIINKLKDGQHMVLIK